MSIVTLQITKTFTNVCLYFDYLTRPQTRPPRRPAWTGQGDWLITLQTWKNLLQYTPLGSSRNQACFYYVSRDFDQLVAYHTVSGFQCSELLRDTLLW